MSNRSNNKQEDLAIQHTLSMTVEQRLELLASLIVDKINEDTSRGGVLLKSIKAPKDARSEFNF